ncbi:MAG: rhomboid family intramembrane serine protease [Flavobacteriales bacterium]|nr:rhomboid family intramembrane serine protease [Flavobacteriales bacterium]
MTISITLIIIIVTVVTSLGANNNPELYAKLLFNPYQVIHRKEWHRIFTHGFVHDRNNIFHLVFNMWVLYIFGRYSEGTILSELGVLGVFLYLTLYFGAMFVATIPALIKYKDNYHYNSVGASGAVSAVLFSMVAMYPISVDIGLILIPFKPPAIIFGILYIGFEMYMQKRGGTNIAHDAHIWGALFGFFFTLAFVPGAFSNFITEVLSVFH